MPSSSSATRHPTRRRTIGMWLDLLASFIATVIVGLLFVAIIATAISGSDHRGSTRVGEVVVGVFFLAALVGCVRWAIRAEHRFRDREPRPKGGLERSWHRSSHPGHYGPASITLGLLLFGGGTIALAVTSISDHSQGERSAYVQNHGSAATGQVARVVDTQHCGRSSCHYTSAVTVFLTAPVDGHGTTIVHVNSSGGVIDGQHVDLLVDPKQPGYAEFPGSPFKGAHTWIITAILAVVCGLFTILLIRGVTEQRRHRARRLLAAHQRA